MRVAVYHGRGRIALEERPDPVAGAGELVVRVRACGLCGSDLMDWYQEPRAPIVLGHEPAGEVIAEFRSTWRRDASGEWKVVFDDGACACPARSPP